MPSIENNVSYNIQLIYGGALYYYIKEHLHITLEEQDFKNSCTKTLALSLGSQGLPSVQQKLKQLCIFCD